MTTRSIPMTMTRVGLIGALALGTVGITSMMPAEAASTAANASAKCWSSTAKLLGDGTVANVPAYNGSTNCWLAYDVQNHNNAVWNLQYSLNRAEGFNLERDGYYGEDTRRAVESVQRRYGLVVDGEYGPNTGRAMKWMSRSGTISRWR